MINFCDEITLEHFHTIPIFTNYIFNWVFMGLIINATIDDNKAKQQIGSL